MSLVDFLGREITEGAKVVYPVSQGSSGAHLSMARVDEIADGTNRWGRPAKVLRVTLLDSTRPGFRKTLTKKTTVQNLERCVVVDRERVDP